jgi:two-component system, NtrC family, nitrogen regulation response regulator NtrX
MKPRILIVDDEPGTLSSLSHALALEGYVALTASAAERALDLLKSETVDAVLSDVVMPGMDGLALLRELRQRAPGAPVVMMSGQATIDTAIQATRLGAVDFLEKPVGLDRLTLTLRNALRLDRLERENRELQRYWKDELALIGDGPELRQLRGLIERAAPSDVPILVLGENGTGKELVARAIHDLSPRRDKPFVKLNCAAVPAELAESELFGHEKGAFSGAVAQRRGRFEQADGGTLFLDEIGDMPAALQAKLLRVLQDGELQRVGGSAEIKVDVRLISATNREIDSLIRSGGFREDLYYRISTLSLRAPPLRERACDIPALCEHFLSAACRRNHWRPRRISDAAVELLQRQLWKGNVRELRNVLERALILSSADPLEESDLRAALGASPSREAVGVPSDGPLRDLVDAFEREVIRERLRRSGGHVTAAAKSLDLERSHFYKKCQRLGLDIRETE